MKRQQLRKLGVRIWILTLVGLVGFAIWLMMTGSGRAVFSIASGDAPGSDGTEELAAVKPASETGSQSQNSLSALFPHEGSDARVAQELASSSHSWGAREESSREELIEGARGPVDVGAFANSGAGSHEASNSTSDSRSGGSAGSLGGSQSARLGASGHGSGHGGGAAAGGGAGAGGGSRHAGDSAASDGAASNPGSESGASVSAAGSEASSVGAPASDAAVSHHSPSSRKVDAGGQSGLLTLDDVASLADPAGSGDPAGIASIPDYSSYSSPTGGASLSDTSGPLGALDTLVGDLGGVSGGLPGDSSFTPSTDLVQDPGLAALVILPAAETGSGLPPGALLDPGSSQVLDATPDGSDRGVPEPALSLLYAMGLGAGALVRRYRRHTSRQG